MGLASLLPATVHLRSLGAWLLARAEVQGKPRGREDRKDQLVGQPEPTGLPVSLFICRFWKVKVLLSHV